MEEKRQQILYRIFDIALLPYSRIAVMPYCRIASLPYIPIALLPKCLDTWRDGGEEATYLAAVARALSPPCGCS